MDFHKPTLRVLKILELIDENSTDGLSLSEISEQLSLPKGTISPILKTLVATKYIQFNLETNRYAISYKSFELGLSFGGNTDILSTIQAMMREIVASVGEICQMGTLSNLNVLYLLKEDPDNAISIVSNVGARLPAYATGLGKALLSGKTDEQLRELYKDYFFRKYAKNTITDLDTLLVQLRQVRQDNLAYENEESKDEICCVAVPLVIDDEIKAALSVTVPKFRYSDEKRQLIIQELQQKKQLIEDTCRVQNYHFDI
ncbi:transcriptional regulator, IclR family [Agrilactobacillus composti DSM 18527 = JCM 14202]|uniref:IclR family transcriptional regulator n=1 Tax=Agrilactobacillus composti TaxID=398555 RepID=UPI00042E0FA7|nr:IclR family transcriptional regulator [Agrilactobacillus composti]GAF41442.1 transcriptional regulator, IclR family [Agrilactobacillus composti DSM 18527 = JCM 14202]